MGPANYLGPINGPIGILGNPRAVCSLNKSLLQGMRLAMYIVGQEETVGESSVSSGCWGEDSDHEYGWARRTPTFVAPIRFFCWLFNPVLIKRIQAAC